MEALPRLGPGRRAALRRPAGHRRRGHRRHARRVQRLRRAAAGAVPHARLHADARPAGGGVGRAHLRDPRHRARDRRPARAPSTWSSRAARWSCATSRSATARPVRCSSTSTCTSRRARRWRSSVAPAAASRPIARLLPRFYDVVRGRGARRRPRRARPHRAQPARRHRPGARRAVPLLRDACATTSPTGGPTRPTTRCGPRPRAAGAEEFIDALPEGFDSEVGERGYTLSGGQRQRVAIARTLLDDPAILILDDATSAIDVQVEEEIHAALRVLMEGRTTLVIAHRLSTINLAERVVLLEGGRDRRRRHPRRADGHRAALRRGARPHRGGRRGRRAGAEERPTRPTRADAGRPRRRAAEGRAGWETSPDGLGRAVASALGRRPFGGGAAAARGGLPVRRRAAGAAGARRQAARARAGPRARARRLRAGRPRRAAVLAAPAARARTGRRWRRRSSLVVLETRRAAGRPAPHPDRDRRRHPRRRPRRGRRASRSLYLVSVRRRRRHEPHPHRVDRAASASGCSTTCASRCSATSSGCRSTSSRARRPGGS